MPKISVVMSVYNGEQYLSEAIRSILNQTYQDFEFIIIDDCSTDGTHKVIESFKDERIILITNSKNLGLTKSLNKGLFWSEGEYIARQDADDISLPERLETQVRYLDEHPEIGVVGTSYYIIDSEGKIIEERKPAPNPMYSLATGNRLTHGSVMFRRSIMETVGKYDEAHFRYAQDYEYWLRISKRCQIRNLEQPLYKLRVHVNSVGVEKAREQALCVILAQRMSENRENSEMLSYNDLTNKEKARFHNMVAYNFMQIGDMSTARSELIKAVRAHPDKENLGNIILTCIGKKRAIQGQNLYRRLRFFTGKYL